MGLLSPATSGGCPAIAKSLGVPGLHALSRERNNRCDWEDPQNPKKPTIPYDRRPKNESRNRCFPLLTMRLSGRWWEARLHKVEVNSATLFGGSE